MPERYLATSPAGDPIIRTNDPATAAFYARVLEGHVIDREEEAA